MLMRTNMKKLLALLLLFGIVGCSEPIAPPEEIAASYYHNLIKAQKESFDLIKNNNKLIKFLKNQ